VNKKSGVRAGQQLFAELGLDELWAEIFQPGSPLAFLTAQSLRVAQPVLSVFMTPVGSASLHSLANRLEAAPDSTEDSDE
jgi:hypothetical protein